MGQLYFPNSDVFKDNSLGDKRLAMAFRPTPLNARPVEVPDSRGEGV